MVGRFYDVRDTRFSECRREPWRVAAQSRSCEKWLRDQLMVIALWSRPASMTNFLCFCSSLDRLSYVISLGGKRSYVISLGGKRGNDGVFTPFLWSAELGQWRLCLWDAGAPHRWCCGSNIARPAASGDGAKCCRG